MEDEECLPENSSLKIYLESLGYTDLEIKNVKSLGNNFKFDGEPKKYNLSPETIEKDVIQQIEILISTQMLFEEDFANIEKLLSNFTIKKNGIMKSMFQGVFGITLIFLGLFLYCLVGAYAFYFVSVFYAYKVADFMWKKNFSQTRLKKLTSVLQSNFNLLNKTVRFIQENNKLCKNYCIENDVTDQLKVGFINYDSFRHDFIVLVNEMIDVLSESTHKLISKCPLYDYIENSQYYVCNNYKSNTQKTVDSYKLYQIYLLAQSEFLQRLILSLIPNVNLNKNDKFKEINKVISETVVPLLKIKSDLNKKFKFVFFNGIYNSNSNSSLKLPSKAKSFTSIYEEELASNIHDVSHSFQNLLLKSRILEENVMSKKFSKDETHVENELITIQNELNFCQKNISDSFILLKKANSGNDKTEVLKVKENEVGSTNKNVSKTKIALYDLDQQIEDEVFEEYFTGDHSSSNFPNYDDWDIDDRIKNKLQKEYSQNVMKELKSKLVEKAKYWRKREAELLEKKFPDRKPDEISNNNEVENNETNFSKTNEKNCDGLSSNILPLLSVNLNKMRKVEKENEIGQNDNSLFAPDEPKYQNVIKNLINNRPINLEQNLDEKQLDCSERDNIVLKSNFEAGNTKFLNDLCLAREKIFKESMLNEEEFCCGSDDNSDLEES